MGFRRGQLISIRSRGYGFDTPAPQRAADPR